MVLPREAAALLGVGEPAVEGLRARPLYSVSDAQQRLGERVLHERHAEVGDDLGGRVEPVEDAQQRGADVVGAEAARRRGVAGELEEVVALVLGEAQRAGERADRLLGGPRAARCSSRA